MAREKLRLPKNKKVVALLPGSRRQEIQLLFPIMLEAAKQLSQQIPSIHFVVPIANSLSESFLSSFTQNLDANLSLTLTTDPASTSILASDAVIVASGTASLEAALLEKPSCIIYKGSLLSYMITTQVIRVKYFGLANLVANKMILPELLQHDCTADNITQTILPYLLNHTEAKRISQALNQMKNTLMCSESDTELDSLVHNYIHQIGSK